MNPLTYLDNLGRAQTAVHQNSPGAVLFLVDGTTIGNVYTNNTADITNILCLFRSETADIAIDSVAAHWGQWNQPRNAGLPTTGANSCWPGNMNITDARQLMVAQGITSQFNSVTLKYSKDDNEVLYTFSMANGTKVWVGATSHKVTH